MSKDVEKKEKEAKEKNKGFKSFVKGSLVIGLSAWAIKKLYDSYQEEEKEEIITEEEYQEEIEEYKKEYIQLTKEESEGQLILFDRSKIEKNSNADKLFRLFLDKAEKVSEIPDKLYRISDIEKLLPMEETELKNRSSYNYSIMSMLGGQANRDYFIFRNTPELREIFTEECNKSNRDNLLWKNQYSEEEFTINPKYIIEKTEAGVYYIRED